MLSVKPLNGTCTTGGSTTAPACAATGCHSPSASTLLDLCPAAACTVQCCLTERNKVLLYGRLEARILWRNPDVEFRDSRGRLPFAPQSGRVLAQWGRGSTGKGEWGTGYTVGCITFRFFSNKKIVIVFMVPQSKTWNLKFYFIFLAASPCCAGGQKVHIYAKFEKFHRAWI